MRKGIDTVLIFSLAMALGLSLLFSPRARAADNPIKIGGSLPLTGIFSESGKWIKQGYDAWVEDVNKKGGLLGRPVKMITYDDESSPDKAVTFYERAITVDKVDLLSGGYPGTANVALMPLAEKYRMVFIGMGGHLKSFEQGYTYSFASPPLMSEWAYLSLSGPLDDFVSKKEWPRTAAVVTMNNVIGLSARGNVVKWIKENGIKLVMDETYNLPLTDATPLISRAKGEKADLFVCLGFFDDAVMLMRSAKAMNYEPKMIFQLLASTIPAWMKELGQDGNDILADMYWNPLLPYPGNKQINEAAKRRLGLPVAPTYFGLGYCWMKTLQLAVEGAGTLDQMKIRDYLRSHKFNLPYGIGITFDKRGLPPKFAYTTQTTKGRVELVWPKDVATTALVYPRPPWRK
jgi:branched-chain amino acid transport system substrate-binding protein